MARSAASAPDAPPRSWTRAFLVALVLLGLVAVGVFVFLPTIRFQMRIGQLHAGDATARKVAVAHLVESEEPDMNDRLEAVLNDPARAFSIRLQVGEILIIRNRDAVVVEALRSDDLDVRTGALAVLWGQARFHGEEWFQRTFLDDPAFRVEETMGAWLARDGDLTRASALGILKDLELPGLLPQVRALIQPPREGALSRAEQRVVIAAVEVVSRYGDCESMPRVAEVAKSAADDLVRLRLTQALYQAIATPQAACADAVPLATLEDLVLSALTEGGSNTRHGALLLLAARPEWADGASEALYGILDGTTGDTEFVRRQALATLSAMGGDDFAARLPRYFHDEHQYVRSQATTASIALADTGDAALRYESAWIGVLEREVENAASYQAAAAKLRDAAGTWVGLPEGLPAGGPARREALKRFRQEMFEGGESGGVSRVDWAEAWFRWWAGKLDLEGDAVEDAVRVRGEFWTAAAAGDAAKARAILEAYTGPTDYLFTYETGWLNRRTGV